MTILTLPIYDHYFALYLILMFPSIPHTYLPPGPCIQSQLRVYLCILWLLWQEDPMWWILRPIVKLVMVELIFTSPLTIFPLWQMLMVLELVEQGEGVALVVSE